MEGPQVYTLQSRIHPLSVPVSRRACLNAIPSENECGTRICGPKTLQSRQGKEGARERRLSFFQIAGLYHAAHLNLPLSNTFDEIRVWGEVTWSLSRASFFLPNNVPFSVEQWSQWNLRRNSMISLLRRMTAKHILISNELIYHIKDWASLFRESRGIGREFQIASLGVVKSKSHLPQMTRGEGPSWVLMAKIFSYDIFHVESKMSW